MEKPDDRIKKSIDNRGCRGEIIHLKSLSLVGDDVVIVVRDRALV